MDRTRYILFSGNYSYRVSKESYQTKRGNFRVSNRDKLIRIKLDQVINSVKFIINPEHALVTVHGVGVFSNNGEVILPQGTYNYAANYPGYNYKSGSFTVKDSDKTVYINLSPFEGDLYGIYGVIYLDTGTILRNSRVVALINGVPRQVQTNNDGKYFLPNLDLGPIELGVSKERYATSYKNVVITQEGTRQDFILYMNEENIEWEYEFTLSGTGHVVIDSSIWENRIITYKDFYGDLNNHLDGSGKLIDIKWLGYEGNIIHQRPGMAHPTRIDSWRKGKISPDGFVDLYMKNNTIHFFNGSPGKRLYRIVKYRDPMYRK